MEKKEKNNLLDFLKTKLNFIKIKWSNFIKLLNSRLSQFKREKIWRLFSLPLKSVGKKKQANTQYLTMSNWLKNLKLKFNSFKKRLKSFRKKKSKLMKERAHIKRSVLIKLGKLDKKKADGIDEFNKLLKEFLCGYYEIKRELTPEELKRFILVKKIPLKLKIRIVKLIDKSTLLKYGAVGNKGEVKGLTADFSEIIKALTKKPKP